MDPRVFELSRLASTSGDPRHLEQLYDIVRGPEYSLAQRHFFYWQSIVKHAAIPREGRLHPSAMYRALLTEARETLAVAPAPIPAARRDPNAIVVITNQLLGPQHAPTADCLDYCHVLQRRLGKQVLLINTADMPWDAPLPYHEPVRFNRLEGYASQTRLDVRGESIAFYQCRRPMPDAGEIARIVRMVQARRPSFVFSLGHSNVAADLCDAIVPVATMPFGTNLPPAYSSVYVLPRQRREDDRAFMAQWQIAPDRIIEAEYTFRLPDRTAAVTRRDLGLPEAGYVIAIVGNRLDSEITDEVANELARLVERTPQVHLAFMGMFARYEDVIASRRQLAGRSVFLGHQKDVLAVYECCDAYLNPPRYGGGSSAAFALAMGLPVLTPPGGDVANIAGEGFVLPSFDATADWVSRAVADQALRTEAAARARRRFDRISNREAMLRTIVDGVAARLDSAA